LAGRRTASQDRSVQDTARRASSGLVRTIARVSGMTELTNRVNVSRTWVIAIVISPSAVWIRRGRWPFREPAASGARS